MLCFSFLSSKTASSIVVRIRYTITGLCSNDPFLVRTRPPYLKSHPPLCVGIFHLPLQAHSPSFCLFCQGANLHHQVPLLLVFQLSLAEREGWQGMRRQEGVGVFIALCRVARGWFRAGWVITEEAFSTRPSSHSLLVQGQ